MKRFIPLLLQDLGSRISGFACAHVLIYTKVIRKVGGRWFIFALLLLSTAASWAEEGNEEQQQRTEAEEAVNTGEDADDEAVPENNANNLRAPHPDIMDTTAAEEFEEYKQAIIIALNKITAKSQELAISASNSKYFGNIEIKVHKCLKITDPYNPDNRILISVIENKIDEDPVVIFQGWIFSSTVSLFTLEHPVYEIFAKDCR